MTNHTGNGKEPFVSTVLEFLRAPLMLLRWLLVGYSSILLIGFMLFRLPDWVYAPALACTRLIKTTLMLALPEGISAGVAIFATLAIPILVVVYSSSEG